MSYNDRIEAALAVVKEHNDALGGKEVLGYIDPEKLISCIKATGGTSEERLAQMSHEDILDCLPKPAGDVPKPRILAKAIAQIFRSKTAEDESKRPVSGRKAEKMTVRELVENFDPEDSTSAIGVRLAEISKKQPFIVFVSGRTVDVETTLKLLLEIKGGFNGREIMEVNGESYKVYRLGELPENYAEENPLYRGRPLRPDGTCDQLGRSWEGVELSVRQFIRVAMDTGELKVTHETAHDILDIVMSPEALKNLRARYRKSSVKFGELQKLGDLPKLKIVLGGSEGDRPFPEGKKVVFAPPVKVPQVYPMHYEAVWPKDKSVVTMAGPMWRVNKRI